jgi:hypothetical protein
MRGTLALSTTAAAAFLDTRRFACQTTQVEQLGAPDGAVSGYFDLLNARGLEHERALNTHAMRHAADTEATVVRIGLFDFEHHAFENLGALTIAFDHSHVHAHRVTRADRRQITAPFKAQ